MSVDYLTVSELGAHLQPSLDAPLLSDGLPVVSIEVLVYLKLVAHPMRDRADVTELLKRGADPTHIRGYLSQHAPDLLERFDVLAEQAARE